MQYAGRAFGNSESTHYLLAVLVGLFAGLAVAFREMISAFGEVFYGHIAGAIGEAGTWPSIFIPAIGGLLVGP